MRFNEIEDFQYVLGAVSILRLLIQYGKGDDLLNSYQSVEICMDYEWDVFFHALNYAAEFFSIRYIGAWDCDEMFFSSEDMTGYYRLCKEFGRKYGIAWKDNPFVINADKNVAEYMNLRDHGYDWKLSTGTRHKYASALHFYRYADFFQTVELVEAVLLVFEFYENGVKSLKAILSKQGGEELIAA